MQQGPSEWVDFHKHITLIGIQVGLISTVPFFFQPSVFWVIGLALAGYASGCGVVAWAYFLKIFTPKNQRIKSCADVLILSNIIMILINVVAMNGFPFLGR